jgi:hypothetical protein
MEREYHPEGGFHGCMRIRDGRPGQERFVWIRLKRLADKLPWRQPTRSSQTEKCRDADVTLPTMCFDRSTTDYRQDHRVETRSCRKT